MTKALQQGQADGMCGLYAVLNFLNRTEWRDTPSNGLWYLLDACRQFGWLTPQHLIDGFEDHHLKAIIDLQFVNYRMNYETFFLSDIFDKFPNLSARQVYTRIVGKKGSVIVQNARGGHWLLVTAENNEPVVFDSADGRGNPAPIEARSLAATSGWGVVILPSQRQASTAEI